MGSESGSPVLPSRPSFITLSEVSCTDSEVGLQVPSSLRSQSSQPKLEVKKEIEQTQGLFFFFFFSEMTRTGVEGVDFLPLDVINSIVIDYYIVTFRV